MNNEDILLNKIACDMEKFVRENNIDFDEDEEEDDEWEEDGDVAKMEALENFNSDLINKKEKNGNKTNNSNKCKCNPNNKFSKRKSL